MQGAAKLRPVCDSRSPVTPQMLQTLVESCQSVTKSPYEQVMFKAMYILAFSAFLRLGEMTSSPHNIQLGQISLDTSSVNITFYTFKHYQGPPIYIVLQNNNSALCPVFSLASYLKLRGQRPGPLFCHPDLSPISSSYFSTILQYSTSWSNFTHLNVKPHSFRIGAATYAASRGVTEQQIRVMGRWKSNAFQKYIRIPTINIKL